MLALTGARDFILSGNAVSTADTVASDSLERQAFFEIDTSGVLVDRKKMRVVVEVWDSESKLVSISKIIDSI